VGQINCGLYPQVVLVNRWFLAQVDCILPVNLCIWCTGQQNSYKCVRSIQAKLPVSKFVSYMMLQHAFMILFDGHAKERYCCTQLSQGLAYVHLYIVDFVLVQLSSKTRKYVGQKIACSHNCFNPNIRIFVPKLITLFNLVTKKN
jgi:hypothetical protein